MEPFEPSGTDQQDWPLDLRWSGWPCLGLGRCPQGASVYSRAVPTSWGVGWELEVGSVWLGYGVWGGEFAWPWDRAGTWGVPPDSGEDQCGSGSLREGVPWITIDRKIFSSSFLCLLFFSFPLLLPSSITL